jgi:hypothetical protein
VSEQLRVLHPSRVLYLLAAPLLAGGALLLATLLPWITDPTGRNTIAWRLPIDLGWQIQTAIGNYGVLCALCACYTFFVTWRVWRRCYGKHINAPLPLTRELPIGAHYTIAGILCLLPPVIFVFQYLCADMNSIADLTRNEMQLLLIKAHFGYSTPPQLVPLQLATFHPLDLTGRLSLLVDLVGTGFFLPFLGAVILLFAAKSAHISLHANGTQPGRRRSWSRKRVGVVLALVLCSLFLFGRAPAALVCNYQAEHLLSRGSYSEALVWLDRAVALNPELNNLTAYHLERGQADYFLHPQQNSMDSLAYLSSSYQQRNDLLSAYQTILAAWQGYPHNSWLLDASSQTLELLAESTKPTQGDPDGLLAEDEPALAWQYKLIVIDNNNLYAQYMIGRALYDLHDYSNSMQQMQKVLDLTNQSDVQSSAYTYIALSKIELGDEAVGRDDLFKAQQLDPDYRNNTARQELSGLR